MFDFGRLRRQSCVRDALMTHGPETQPDSMKAERCDQGWNLSFRGSDDSIVTEKLMAVTGVTSIPNLRLIGKFWDVVTHLSDSHAGYSKGDHISLLKPEVDRKRSVRFFPSHPPSTTTNLHLLTHAPAASSGRTQASASSLSLTSGPKSTPATSA